MKVPSVLNINYIFGKITWRIISNNPIGKIVSLNKYCFPLKKNKMLNPVMYSMLEVKF